MTTPILMTNDRIALVDDTDSDLAEMNWHFHQRYVVRKKMHNRKITKHYLHHAVMERMLGRPIAGGMVVDHINGNTCDNRRGNLREVTVAENNMNKGMSKNNTSGYKGVHRVSGKNKPWRTEIHYKGKRIFIGHFFSPEAAAVAYNAAAKKYYGENARLNTLPDNTTLF